MAWLRGILAIAPKALSLRRLWLIAHQAIWNEAGTKGGKRLDWLTCPKSCNPELWGCDGKTPKHGALHTRFPGRFGEWEVPYCPRKIISERDLYTSHVVATYRDYRNGAVANWPDGHCAAVVDGVRYLDSEIDAATAAAYRG